MPLHGKNLVAGRLTTGTGETFKAVSPLDRSELPTAFSVASVHDIDAAARAADDAFTAFRRSTGAERATFLERIADEIERLGDALLEQAHRETGLPLPRLTGERARTTGQLRMFAAIAREGSWVDARIDRALPNREPQPRPDLRRMLIPLGPVVVFGSSNFPFAYSVAGGDTASALATGNPVIVKAHERHPGTSELVATAINVAVESCGMPAGVFSLLHGTGKAVGLPLVRHPLVLAVGFTGSHTAGRALFDAAAARPSPIPVFAEMSSLNPVFILPEAALTLRDKIAEGLKNSLTLGMGQFCTKPGLVFGVQGASFDNFQQALAAQLQTVAPATLLHGGIFDTYYTAAAKKEHVAGVTRVAQSQAAEDPAKTQGRPWLVRTDADHFEQHPELAEEVFGPFGVLVAADSLQRLKTIARRLQGQLTATLHGTAGDLAQAGELIQVLERKAGRLIINGYPTGVEVCAAMNHGGPYPATSDVRFTAVGSAALARFVRPVCYQNFPADQLPPELRDENPLKIRRLIDGALVLP